LAFFRISSFVIRHFSLTSQPSTLNQPMPVNTTHPDYELYAPSWSRARDVLAGEDAVKAAGERYLRRIQDHDLLDYDAYRGRATFYNATARTASGYIGMIFRRAPFVKLPDAPAMKEFTNDADLLGTTLYGYAKQIVTEVVQVGRAGTLIDWEPTEGRPYASTYRAEDIVNWRVDRVLGRSVPTLIVLAEQVNAFGKDEFTPQLMEQRRVLRLSPAGMEYRFDVEIWREIPRPGLKPEWVLVERHTPLRHGLPLRQIPFVFHGTHHSRPAVERPHSTMSSPSTSITTGSMPITSTASISPPCQPHGSRASTWLNNSRSALPSPGPAADTSARAGYLEYQGHGLQSFERALERDERLMALLGSRLLEGQKRVAETAEALSIRQAGEESILANIATTVSEGLTQVLRWAHWWSAENASTTPPPDDIGDDQIVFELNTDFGITGMTARELAAVVSAWQAGAFSRDTMLELFRKGEILPDGRTNEEEVRLLGNGVSP
jgi:hypothetical protein